MLWNDLPSGCIFALEIMVLNCPKTTVLKVTITHMNVQRKYPLSKVKVIRWNARFQCNDCNKIIQTTLQTASSITQRYLLYFLKMFKNGCSLCRHQDGKHLQQYRSNGRKWHLKRRDPNCPNLTCQDTKGQSTGMSSQSKEKL